MAKGWVFFASNSLDMREPETREEILKRDRKFQNLIRNTHRRNEEQTKKDTEAEFKKAQARKDSLLTAYKEKKLKSKDLIKEARSIKQKRKNKSADGASVEATT